MKTEHWSITKEECEANDWRIVNHCPIAEKLKATGVKDLSVGTYWWCTHDNGYFSGEIEPPFTFADYIEVLNTGEPFEFEFIRTEASPAMLEDIANSHLFPSWFNTFARAAIKGKSAEELLLAALEEQNRLLRARNKGVNNV